MQKLKKCGSQTPRSICENEMRKGHFVPSPYEVKGKECTWRKMDCTSIAYMMNLLRGN